MEKITININNVETRSDIHDVLTEALNLPEYYGRNLDALYDCLSTLFIGKKVEFELIGFTTLPENLEHYGETIISIFRRVEKENAGKDNSIFAIASIN